MVNEPSVFEPVKFDCISYCWRNSKDSTRHKLISETLPVCFASWFLLCGFQVYKNIPKQTAMVSDLVLYRLILIQILFRHIGRQSNGAVRSFWASILSKIYEQLRC